MLKVLRKLSQTNLAKEVCHQSKRCVSAKCVDNSTGLVLGTYIRGSEDKVVPELTETALKYNIVSEGKLVSLLGISGPPPRKHEYRILNGVESTYPNVTMIGLGHNCVGYNEEEEIDECKEKIREAAATGVRVLSDICYSKVIYLEDFGHAESAAEGAVMGLWKHQEHKTDPSKADVPRLQLFNSCDLDSWHIGLIKGEAQNLARRLCELPANMLVPRRFAEFAVDFMYPMGINIEIKTTPWLKDMGMNAFLAVAKGSCHEPILLEASYIGCDPCTPPIVMIGKGVTFDTGGFCLKTPEDMWHKRGDMSGAACVIAAMKAAATLQLAVNIRALIPLCENMLGPNAMKPGDIERAMNGRTIAIDSTDTQSKLIMTDVLSYAAKFKPTFTLDIGTLSRGVRSGLGSAATGVFTNNEKLWENMRLAGIHTGDRVWRLPLWNHFDKFVKYSDIADYANTADALGSACRSAALLKQFACGDWIHLDNYGVAREAEPSARYLRPGMTGRPTRTLIEFLAQCTIASNGDVKTPSDEKLKLKAASGK
ncbi:cytosol aminopeptidase [Nilaparvata lugens]|uniref:cytosol aminopeptidase n=1 Tax=Nilaparvata lugens TaxID=108931 RepID=UPI00193CE246|nr:cytosol aminopeptidase [Nilaparvata lugens]